MWGSGTELGPARYFCLRSDVTLKAVLAEHGALDEWTTWPGPGDPHYQWAAPQYGLVVEPAQIRGNVHGVLAQRLQRDDVQGTDVGCGQNDGSCSAHPVRL